MRTNGELFRPEFQEFLQPSRPLHAYYTTMESSSTPLEYGFSDQYFDESYDFEEQEQEKRYVTDGDLQQKLRGFVDELDVKCHEKLKKLFTKVEKDVPFERLFRETLKEFRGRHDSDVFEKFLSKLNSDPVNDPSSRDRGLDSNELKHKLERFRVKTNNVIGIVKKDPVNGPSSRDRGLDGDSNELKQKLERFRVKTNNVIGIVKKDLVNDPSSRDRGLDGDSNELKHKLERFKVKTINVIGIVKKEQK